MHRGSFFRFILFIFLALNLGACASYSRQKQDQKNQHRAQLHMEIGTTHLMNGRYPEAMSELIIAAQLDPRSPQIQNNLALAYFARNRFAEAETHFRRALELDSRFTEARNNLGRLVMQVGRLDEAVSLFQASVEDLTFSRPGDSLLNLGEALYRKRDFKGARTYLEQAAQVDRESCPAHFLYGRSLYELGEFSLAARTLDAAIRLCPSMESEDPHFYSALSYAKIGQRTQAIARLEEMMSMYPGGRHQSEAQKMLDLLK